MAREALNTRLQLIHLVAVQRHQVFEQIEPDKPTKGIEIAELLKQILKAISKKLPDPEPTPTELTEEQKQIAMINNGTVAIRAKRLMENLAKVEAALLTDHGGRVVMDWTDEQKQGIVEHLTTALQELQDAIDAL